MRDTFRALLLLVLLAVLGVFVFAWWGAAPARQTSNRRLDAPAGTSGTIDIASARERGAEIGERAAVATAKVKEATARVQETVADGRLTAKIKAKMALDDSVKALAINVTTVGSTVTLGGRVASAREHDRAVALARETDGVTRVVDNLRIEN